MSELSERVAVLEESLRTLKANLDIMPRVDDYSARTRREDQRTMRAVDTSGRTWKTFPINLWDTLGSAAAALVTAEAYTDSALGAFGTRNLNVQTTIAQSQANTNENDLMTYSIAAGKMATNGDAVTCRMVFFTNAAIPATRDIRAYYNGQVIYDSTAVAGLVSTTLVLDIEILRVSSTAQKIVVIADGDFTILSSVPTRTAGTGTMANALVLKATSQQGAGAGVGDVTQASMNTLYTPVAV